MSSRTSSDLLQQSLVRLSNRLFELGAWRNRELIFLSHGEIRLQSDAPWLPIKPGDFWPSREEHVEVRFSGTIPKGWAEFPVHCRFFLGGEALLFVNDEPIGGLNLFQNEHPVLDKAVGGETLRFRAEVVPHSLFGVPNKNPMIELACVLVPDTDVRALYEDLEAALEAARYLHSAGRTFLAERLVDAIKEAFTGIALPRGDTAEYLSRIAAISKSHSAESFYGNQESLASLWENWTFRDRLFL